MAKTAVITTRIEPELKAEVEKILDDLGLTISEAVTIYCQQIVLQRGIPFLIRLPQSPTDLTGLRDLSGLT